jgi:hypothetical protein
MSTAGNAARPYRLVKAVYHGRMVTLADGLTDLGQALERVAAGQPNDVIACFDKLWMATF